jgi:hypothetical protein
MIIVTANVGLLPSEIAKKRSLYHRQEGWFLLSLLGRNQIFVAFIIMANRAVEFEPLKMARLNGPGFWFITPEPRSGQVSDFLSLSSSAGFGFIFAI